MLRNVKTSKLINDIVKLTENIENKEVVDEKMRDHLSNHLKAWVDRLLIEGDHIDDLNNVLVLTKSNLEIYLQKTKNTNLQITPQIVFISFLFSHKLLIDNSFLDEDFYSIFNEANQNLSASKVKSNEKWYESFSNTDDLTAKTVIFANAVNFELDAGIRKVDERKESKENKPVDLLLNELGVALENYQQSIKENEDFTTYTYRPFQPSKQDHQVETQDTENINKAIIEIQAAIIKYKEENDPVALYQTLKTTEETFSIRVGSNSCSLLIHQLMEQLDPADYLKLADKWIVDPQDEKKSSLSSKTAPSLQMPTIPDSPIRQVEQQQTTPKSRFWQWHDNLGSFGKMLFWGVLGGALIAAALTGWGLIAGVGAAGIFGAIGTIFASGTVGIVTGTAFSVGGGIMAGAIAGGVIHQASQKKSIVSPPAQISVIQSDVKKSTTPIETNSGTRKISERLVLPIIEEKEKKYVPTKSPELNILGVKLLKSGQIDFEEMADTSFETLLNASTDFQIFGVSPQVPKCSVDNIEEVISYFIKYDSYLSSDQLTALRKLQSIHAMILNETYVKLFLALNNVKLELMRTSSIGDEKAQQKTEALDTIMISIKNCFEYNTKPNNLLVLENLKKYDTLIAENEICYRLKMTLVASIENQFLHYRFDKSIDELNELKFYRSFLQTMPPLVNELVGQLTKINGQLITSENCQNFIAETAPIVEKIRNQGKLTATCWLVDRIFKQLIEDNGTLLQEKPDAGVKQAF